MVDVSESVTINRPVDEVFAYVTDTSNDPAWHTDVLEANKTKEGPIGVGTTWHLRVKPAMGVSEGDTEVVTFDSNRKEVMRGEMGPMHPTLTYLFEPVDGGTKFTRRVQIEVTGWMRVMTPLMTVIAKRGSRGFVKNLKQVLELGAAQT